MAECCKASKMTPLPLDKGEFLSQQAYHLLHPLSTQISSAWKDWDLQFHHRKLAEIDCVMFTTKNGEWKGEVEGRGDSIWRPHWGLKSGLVSCQYTCAWCSETVSILRTPWIQRHHTLNILAIKLQWSRLDNNGLGSEPSMSSIWAVHLFLLMAPWDVAMTTDMPSLHISFSSASVVANSHFQEARLFYEVHGDFGAADHQYTSYVCRFHCRLDIGVKSWLNWENPSFTKYQSFISELSISG